MQNPFWRVETTLVADEAIPEQRHGPRGEALLFKAIGDSMITHTPIGPYGKEYPVTDTSGDTTEARTAHARRLGPFHTDGDSSVHDETITALVGAYAARCETCTVLQTPRLAANTPALVRLLELTGRSYTARSTSLHELAGNHDHIRWIADLAEAKPKQRAALLDGIVAEGRVRIATAAAQLLVGVWIPEKMRADAPAYAAAEAQRVTERYGLTGPPEGGDPEWAWAVFHSARRQWQGMPAGSYTTTYTLHIAPTADPVDEDYLLGPLVLDRGHSERHEAERVLR